MKFLLALAVIAAIWWFGQRRRPAMSAAEARRLLEVPRDADEASIRAAHRRLIQRVHPDAGGSAALAARVNAARDILVSELNRKRG